MISLLGNWASILGLLITITGFFLTFLKVQRVRRMVMGIIQRVNIRLLGTNLDFGVRITQALHNACVDGDWTTASNHCELLMSFLRHQVNEEELPKDEKVLTPDEQNFFQVALDDLDIILNALISRKQLNIRKSLDQEASKRIREIGGRLERLSKRLQRQTLRESVE